MTAGYRGPSSKGLIHVDGFIMERMESTAIIIRSLMNVANERVSALP